MPAVPSFVPSIACAHVSTACLFCTDERPVDLFGRDWGDLALGHRRPDRG
jgi:hypothetical protein